MKTHRAPHSLWGVLEQLFLPAKDSPSTFIILGGITLIGFILRVLDINKSIAYDEAYTFIHFASREFKHILADYSAPNNHIFHTILVGISYRIFGGQPWALRLPAFIAGVLMIPATYLAGRRFFSSPQALAAAGLIGITPLFINYSVNARGYTLLALFSLLLANFAAILVSQPPRLQKEAPWTGLPALLAFTLTAAIGFYTIPIFLYPMAGISLWVLATYLFEREPVESKRRTIGIFLGACVVSLLLTVVLYSPVILFGTGLYSLVGNEIVRSLSWSTFVENLDPRIIRAWNKWMIGFDTAAEYVFIGGFFVSLLFYRKVSNQKLPLQVCLVLAVAVLLVLQRVSPLPRIWLYLAAFYLVFAAAGLVWLARLPLERLAGSSRTGRILEAAILLVFVGAFVNILVARANDPVIQDRDLLPEAYAAQYLAEHMRPEDVIVATGPVDIQTAYYLTHHDISFDRFYKRDHPVEIQNALVLVRKNSNYKTPESVVEFFQLEHALNLSKVELVFEYANVQIYSVPARGE